VLNLHLAQALAGPLRAGLAAEAHSMTTDDHRQRLAALRRKETGDVAIGG
jgi:enoyl-CoA hydratase